MQKRLQFSPFLKLGLIILILIITSSILTGEIDFKKGLPSGWRKISALLNHNVQAQSPQTAYVATTPDDCGNFIPCFTNTDGIDDINGQGTGLRDAVVALNEGDEIVILNDYTIKDNTVLIDKTLTIRGHQNAQISYPGSNCSLPMLSFTAGGAFTNLTLTGGDCAGASRDLVTINTPQDLTIEHSTLQGGNRAINIKGNDGKVTIAFNLITDNQDYAVYQGKGVGAGIVEIYANNIHHNRAGAQVNCNNLGNADHNFWGEGILPADAVEFCAVEDAKRLGAPILVLADSPGVQAIRQTITEDLIYAFDGNIGVKRNLGSDYDLVIVNHGQGKEENIPFLESGATPIVACSNFYDVFLASNAIASDLILSLKYDLNDVCITGVESDDFCGGGEESRFPLWWYDPVDNLTDGWDRTGQIPEGDNPLNFSGQITTCNLSNDEIQVTIDTTGRPGIGQDLHFTPFVAGLPVGSSDINNFDVALDVDKIDIRWETGIESKILGYRVLRSSSQSGPYYRISPLINSLGSNTTYKYTNYLDTSDFNKTYYYKIEIINLYSETIKTHGPQSIITVTPTPTVTLTRTTTPTRTLYPTRTPYPTRTATQYIYRSPTPFYRPGTATPFSTPTKVRTDRASPTYTLTPINNGLNLTGTEDTSYSGENRLTGTATLAPFATELSGSTKLTLTKTPDKDIPPSSEEEKPEEEQQGKLYLKYLSIGLVSGFGILGIASILLKKIYLG